MPSSWATLARPALVARGWSTPPAHSCSAKASHTKSAPPGARGTSGCNPCTPGQVAIASRTAAGVYTTLATCPGAFSPKLTQLDLYLNYGTSGEVALYSNSVKVCGFTGDVTNGDGAANINKMEFASPQGLSGLWSEVIVADTDTRAMARFTAYAKPNPTRPPSPGAPCGSKPHAKR